MTSHRPCRVLVTGGTGFIGSHLVDALIRRGDEVTILDDLSNSTAENIPATLDPKRYVQGDCTRAADVLRAVEAELVFHLGAPAYVPPSIEDPITDLRRNVEQTLHLLDAIRQQKRPPRLVHVSSAAVYGHPPVQPIRETYPPAPVSPYGVDKYAAEEHVRVATQLHGLRSLILRYFPVFGPRQRKQVVYDLITKLLNDPTTLEVYGTGRELRDLCYVDDVVRATLIAADRAPGRGEAYNIGTGRMVTIEHVARTVADVLGAEPKISFTGAIRPGDAERLVGDITQIRTLGFEPQVIFRDGISRTVSWVRADRSGHASVARRTVA